MKKLLSLFTLLVMLGMGTTARAEKNLQRIDVKTAEEFVNALKVNYNDPKYGPIRGADIHLLNDIDFLETKSDGTHLVFDGDHVLDGIWNGKITGAGVDEDGNKMAYALKNLNYTLFEELHDAEITELLIINGSFKGRNTKSGMLADYCINTTLKGIMFSNISAVGDADSYDCDRMGTAIGKAENSTFSNLIFYNCRLITDGQYVGQAAGYAEGCTFNTCIVDGYSEIWADGNSDEGFGSNAYAGSICGYAVNCGLTQCVNMSTVSGDDDRIGGILGYGDNTTVSDCRNAGIVKHCGKEGFGRYQRAESQRNLLISTAVFAAVSVAVTGSALHFADYNAKTWHWIRRAWKDIDFNLLGDGWWGGISWKDPWVKTMESYSAAGNPALGAVVSVASYIAIAFPVILPIVTAGLFASYNILAIYNIAADPDEMGGIVGTAQNGCQILRCVNHGPVLCDDDDCGGIVGQLEESTVADCYNRSFVRGKTDVAGIVGYVISGTVKNCLNVGSVTCSEQSGYYGITGEESGTNNIGGNFYLADEYKNHNTCYSITQDQLASGWVAKQLNDARIAAGDTAIWRQELGGEDGDFYPCYADILKPIVTNTVTDYSLVQKISDAGGFYLAVTNPNAQISLQNDIDLSGLGVLLSTYENPFRGTIQGNGHALRGFHYETTTEDYRESGADGYGGTPHDIALFPFAIGARFENLIIDNFHLYQKDEYQVGVYNEALLVGTADYCEFSGITLRNSTMLLNDDKDNKWKSAGLVAVAQNTQKQNGKNSSFADCKIESSCKFEGHWGELGAGVTTIGGLVSRAYNTLFVRCHNAGEIWADDDNEGGICAYAEGCGFVSCLNTGKVTGQSKVGGIVGNAGSCDIIQCVNVGTICGDKKDSDNDHIGGIVGLLESNVSHVKYCLDFGNLADTDGGSENGAIIGVWKNHNFDNNYVNNIYYYSHNKNHSDNLSDFGYTHDDVLSGKVAFNFKNADNQNFLYQSLDNDAYFTNLPVPLPEAGEVFQNKNCNGNIVYSNLYNNTEYHPDNSWLKWGFCPICGESELYSNYHPQNIEIASAADLVTLSKGVSMGVDYSNTTITLAGDLDFEGVTDFMPIGTSIDRPFRGTFNGNGHRIKNLHIKRTSEQTGLGLFGVVTGNSTIEGITMDSSCSVDGGNSLGVGGLVGCVMTGSISDSGILHVSKCGNEATVRGGENVAGLVGGVYDKAHDGTITSNCQLTIDNCYNAGQIAGNKVSAALVGYGHSWIDVKRCFNVGAVSGYYENHPMVHYRADDAQHVEFSKLIQLESLPADEHAETATAREFVLGYIASPMHSPMDIEVGVWGQNIGTEYYPTISDKGIYHERSMSRTWGTAILPYSVTSNDDVQLYEVASCTIDGESGSMTLAPVDKVDSNTPFFFMKKADSATSISFPISRAIAWMNLPSDNAWSVTKQTSAEGWSLTGTYSSLSGLSDVYYLAQDKLWYAEDAIEVPAFRAFLTYNGNGEQAKSLSILLEEDGETTQIGEIRNGELHMYDGKYLERGKVVIIKNGKKYNTQGQLLK